MRTKFIILSLLAVAQGCELDERRGGTEFASGFLMDSKVRHAKDCGYSHVRIRCRFDSCYGASEYTIVLKPGELTSAVVTGEGATWPANEFELTPQQLAQLDNSLERHRQAPARDEGGYPWLALEVVWMRGQEVVHQEMIHDGTGAIAFAMSNKTWVGSIVDAARSF